jgi:hypothetical protein
MLQQAGYSKARALTGGWSALVDAGRGMVSMKMT